MGPVGRGNVLESPCLEYCIHGHFLRTEADRNGTHGACWVPLAHIFGSMVEGDDFAENITVEAVDAKIKEFEESQLQRRRELQAKYWSADDADA